MKNELLTKGIILPSGEIGKDKINLVAGAITQPFAEMVSQNNLYYRYTVIPSFVMVKIGRILAVGIDKNPCEAYDNIDI